MSSTLETLQENFLESSEPSDTASDTFTVVAASIHRTIKRNSLDRLIADLRKVADVDTKENADVATLRGYRVEPFIEANKRKAWLIHLDTDPKHHLFVEEGFKFTGRHIRVDKYFANDNTLKAKKGFTACHYTEQYENQETSELIIVHVYIGQHGSVISRKIKRYKKRSDGKLEKIKDFSLNDLSLQDPFKKLANENSQSALALVKELVQEKRKLYNNAFQQSSAIDAEINVLLQKILMNDLQEEDRLKLASQYKTLVERFLAEVKKINRYDDQVIDKRGDLIQLYQFMDSTQSMPISTGESEEHTEDEEGPGVSFETEAVQTSVVSEGLFVSAAQRKENKLSQEKEQLLEEIQKLSKKLDNLTKKHNVLDAKQLILLQEYKLTLRSKLVELAFFPGITEKDNEFLRKKTTQMNRAPYLVDSFKQAIQKGELALVTQLYPHVQNEYLCLIFQYFIAAELVESTGKKLENIVETAKFLYQNSAQYRQAMIGLDSVFQGPGPVIYSMLLKAVRFNNKLAFELMLNQGLDPNGNGLMYQEITASVIDAVLFVYVANARMQFERNLGHYNAVLEGNISYYIKTLLEHGAIVDLKTPNIVAFFVPDFTNPNPKIDVVSYAPLTKQQITPLVINALNKKTSKKFDNKKKVRIRVRNAQTSGDKDSENNENLPDAELRTMLKQSTALETLIANNKSPKVELLQLLAPESGLASLINAWVNLVTVDNVDMTFVIGTKTNAIFACENKNMADQMEYICRNELCGRKNISLIMQYNDARETKANQWVDNVTVLVQMATKKYLEVLKTNPEVITNLHKAFIKKVQEAENSDERCFFCLAALYLLRFNENPSFEDTQKIIQVFCLLGKTQCDDKMFLVAKTSFSYAYFCCKALQYDKELAEKTRFPGHITKKMSELNLDPLEVTLGLAYRVLELNRQWSSAIINSQQILTGSPITTAAVVHVRQAPSLERLANTETSTECNRGLRVSKPEFQGLSSRGLISCSSSFRIGKDARAV